MTGRWKPYPKYKDSGVEWLGQVPEGWEVLPVKFCAQIENSGAFGDELGNSPFEFPVCTTATITPEGSLLFKEMPLRSFSVAETKRYVARSGDIFVVKSSGSNTNIISGKLAMVSDVTPPVVPGNFLMRIRPRADRVVPAFIARLLSSQLTRERIKRMVATTTYPNLNIPEYIGSKIPIPACEHQRAIASFLDRETGKIDALVEKKERMVALLKEKRQALITRCVTRGLPPDAARAVGLDSNPPLKDSGVEWLGQVPEGWEVERTKWILRERDERSVSGEEELLTVSHITGVTPRSEKEVYMFEAETTEGYKICRLGDLAINTLWAWMGAMGVSPIDGIVSPAYNVYIPGKRLFPKFIDFLVRMPIFAQEVTRYSSGVWSSRLRLYPKGLFETYFPIPPIPEQLAIAAYLDTETAKIDSLVGKIESAVEKLKEYRSALISAAVTGKIDVRGEAA